MSVSQEDFEAAVEYIKSGPAISGITLDMKLKFYGLFKQGTTGPCNEKAPSRLRITERAKWDAWNKLGKMSKNAAMKEYITQLESLVPEWRKWKKSKL